jgi:hypothetical protein
VATSLHSAQRRSMWNLPQIGSHFSRPPSAAAFIT